MTGTYFRRPTVLTDTVNTTYLLSHIAKSAIIQSLFEQTSVRTFAGLDSHKIQNRLCYIPSAYNL